MGDGIRLQKVLAAAGIASRRVSEALIEAGRVRVDGKVVREMGVRVDPERQLIEVDGERIATASEKVYLAFNKPAGVITTMHDHPEHRPCVGDYFQDFPERLFHVGRLDMETEGLLLLTNDGDLAQRLAHPRYGVVKTYLAQVRGPLGREVGKSLREGVLLEDGLARVDSFTVRSSDANRVMVEVTIHEGRNHIVRRMLEAVDHPVERLVRTQIGPVTVGQLRPGRYRALSAAEVGNLLTTVGL
jgi:23S rRNA pseudouridine2605 synthase